MTDTKEACPAAARPDVDVKYQNHCVKCEPDYVDKEVTLNNGYHYHATTGCGTKIEQNDAHSPMIGYAMDSYPMHARLNEKGEVPADLDSCSGHRDEARGYHYHVQEAGANQFLGCFTGEKGCTFEGDGAGETCDASSASTTGGAPPISRQSLSTKTSPFQSKALSCRYSQSRLHYA